MALTDIFNAKFANNEDKLDWAQLVIPEARGGCGFVVSMFFEDCVKEIIGKFSILGEAI